MLIRSWRDAETAFDDAIADCSWMVFVNGRHLYPSEELRNFDMETYRESLSEWLEWKGVDTALLTGQPLYW